MPPVADRLVLWLTTVRHVSNTVADLRVAAAHTAPAPASHGHGTARGTGTGTGTATAPPAARPRHRPATATAPAPVPASVVHGLAALVQRPTWAMAVRASRADRPCMTPSEVTTDLVSLSAAARDEAFALGLRHLLAAEQARSLGKSALLRRLQAAVVVLDRPASGERSPRS
ncbi:MAG: hypothetical protein JWN17_853 [Frankiales bacterium]|nr:hypothetical protein [Frankiales bacterium]